MSPKGKHLKDLSRYTGCYHLGGPIFWFIVCTNEEKHYFLAFSNIMNFWIFFQIFLGQKNNNNFTHCNLLQWPKNALRCTAILIFAADRDGGRDFHPRYQLSKDSKMKEKWKVKMKGIKDPEMKKDKATCVLI